LPEDMGLGVWTIGFWKCSEPEHYMVKNVCCAKHSHKI
jgi:hypothetical protein